MHMHEVADVVIAEPDFEVESFDHGGPKHDKHYEHAEREELDTMDLVRQWRAEEGVLMTFFRKVDYFLWDKSRLQTLLISVWLVFSLAVSSAALLAVGVNYLRTGNYPASEYAGTSEPTSEQTGKQTSAETSGQTSEPTSAETGEPTSEQTPQQTGGELTHK